MALSGCKSSENCDGTDWNTKLSSIGTFGFSWRLIFIRRLTVVNENSCIGEGIDIIRAGGNIID